MSPAFFTTDDGDIVLRAGVEPGSKHDFRVHKLILSLTSSVFKDMLAIPQPLAPALNGQHQLPVVGITDDPRIFDTILRFIYPGAEPPKITEPSTLSALLFTADKYNITSIYPVLRESLRTFLLPSSSFWVYIMACRFGFTEVAREAAKMTNTRSLSSLQTHEEDVKHISSTELYRLVQFVLAREREGLSSIRLILGSHTVESAASCPHGKEDAQGYYLRLREEVEHVFIDDPCVQELSMVLDRLPDPPLACSPPSKAVGEYDDEEILNCPLRPVSIRLRLGYIINDLRIHNVRLLDKFF